MKRRDFIRYGGAAAAIWPLGARAQQPGKLPTVGILNSITADDARERMEAFRKGLEDAGYVDGRNVTLVYRWAEYHYERLPAMARDLVRQGVDVILACGGDNSIQAAMAATKTIPIVFTTGNDPVSAGYVQSLNRPGGNATGMSFYGSGLEAKRIELLYEIDPKAVSIAVLMGSGNARTESDMRQIEGAAKTYGLRVRFVKASSEDELGPAFRDIVAHRDNAVHIVTNPFFANRARVLAALAGEAGLPATSEDQTFAAAGGLLSYGASPIWAYHGAGAYAGRILKGEKPGEIPIQLPARYGLTINLKTAKALGLTVPLTLLGRADEVIE